jgi:hypothetical protein
MVLDGLHQTRLSAVVIATTQTTLVLVLSFVNGRGKSNARAKPLERSRREYSLENENDDGRESEIGWYEKRACPQAVLTMCGVRTRARTGRNIRLISTNGLSRYGQIVIRTLTRVVCPQVRTRR